VVPSATPLFVRASVLGGMYLVQGLVYGFATFVLIPTLAARGVALETQTGLLALAGLPWVLKIVWGPVVDGVLGLRRSPAVIATVAMIVLAICAGVLALRVDGDATAAGLAIAWLGLNLALSLQDVATDALAFDVVAHEERGRVQAVMLLGLHLGHEGLAGVWLAGIAAAHGLGAPMWIVAVVAVVLAALPLALSSPEVPRVREPIAQVLRALVRDPRSRTALVLAALVLVADVVTSALVGAFWIERLGWRAEDLGPFLAPVLLLGGIVGYALATVVVDRIGHRRTAAVGTVALGVCWIGFALAEPLWVDRTFMRIFVVVQGIATALLLAGVHAILMDVLAPRVRATQYAIATACLNLPRAWAPLVAPALLASFGFAPLFVVCGIYQVAVVALVLAVPRRGAMA
jgi:MFS family permease